MRIALGVLGGLAVAVAGAGWWAPVGIVLAAVFVMACSAVPTEPSESPEFSEPSESPEFSEPSEPRMRVLDGVQRAARLGVVVFAASTFAEYVVPDHRQAAAVLLVAAVALADVAGLRLDAYWKRWIGAALAVAGVAFVAVCLGITPATAPAMQPAPAAADPGAAWGVPLAAAVFVPVFADTARRVVIAGGALAVVVSAAALYQLGPVRLGLSPTALRDVFAAADAQALTPVLGIVVALACVPAALLAFTAARRGAHPSPVMRTVIPAAVAAVPAAVLSPVGAVTVAAALAVADLAARTVVTGSAAPHHIGRIAVVTAAGVLLAGVLLAGVVTGL